MRRPAGGNPLRFSSANRHQYRSGRPYLLTSYQRHRHVQSPRATGLSPAPPATRTCETCRRAVTRTLRRVRVRTYLAVLLGNRTRASPDQPRVEASRADARFDVRGNQAIPLLMRWNAAGGRDRGRGRKSLRLRIAGVNLACLKIKRALLGLVVGAGRPVGGLAVAFAAVDRRARRCRRVLTIRACPWRMRDKAGPNHLAGYGARTCWA